MRLMEGGLGSSFVIEERKMRFEEFVKEQRARGYPGTGWTPSALHNNGYRDSYGPVIYEKGMRNGKWILPDGKNPNVLIFPNRDEALSYGKSLLPILNLYGYMHSKVWVDEVSVHMSFGNPFTGSLAPTDMYDEKDRYVLRIKVQ